MTQGQIHIYIFLTGKLNTVLLQSQQTSRHSVAVSRFITNAALLSLCLFVLDVYIGTNSMEQTECEMCLYFWQICLERERKAKI